MNGVIKLGMDAGNKFAKVAGPFGVMQSKSAICDWFERDVVEVHGEDDLEFVVNGRKGFFGSIAEDEDEFGGVGMYGNSKAHEDAKIRVLMAIHRYLEKHCPDQHTVNIIVGQPVATHKESEKKRIKEMLEGFHAIQINGEERIIVIDRVEVATEGGGAFWNIPQMGTIRILDCGSGTVNAITMKDKRHINNGSGTFNFGAETITDKSDIEGLAHGIIRNATKLKWEKSDLVYVCGGVTENILPYIQKHFPNAQKINPQYRHYNGVSVLHPVYANAVGFYKIANGVFR